MDVPKGKTRKSSRRGVLQYLDARLYLSILSQVRGRMRGSRRFSVEPEDCVQEACLTAAEHSSSFKGRTRKQALAWILGIADYRLRMLLRQHSFERRHAIQGVDLDDT